MRFSYHLIVGVVFVASCVDTGQAHTEFPLFVSGTEVSEPVMGVGDVPIWIDRAELAFGPLYLCAGASAGDLCETARAEWLGSVVIDATDGTPKEAGQIKGVTGPVRSWMYDLGLSSQLTQESPFVSDAAQKLGGASLVIEGRADVDGDSLPFRIDVSVQQNTGTEQGIPVIRKSASERFFHDIAVGEEGLLVKFDPKMWVSGLDFRTQLQSESCEDVDVDIVCDGMTERSCEGGEEIFSQDCAALSQICIRDAGCVQQLQLEPASEGHRYVWNQLTSGARPEWIWGDPN